MAEVHSMETRRRSRSKTPFLRSNCDHESCEHAGDEEHIHKKKTIISPNVQTIIEETVEVTSSSGVTTQNTKQISSQKQQQHKIKTSDYSSEDTSPEGKLQKINEQNKKTAGLTSNSTLSSSTTVVTKTKKIGSKIGGIGISSVMSSSTPKANYVESYAAQFSDISMRDANGPKEISQNELNAAKEKNISFSRFFGNSFNSTTAEQSTNCNVGDHIAYMEYKRAGEYWKTTPKTDYTYSELSPHRRELAPGVVAMPNMSRRSLESHHERVEYMIQREPAQEDFIRRRYETKTYAVNRRGTDRLTYDSGDEVDVTQFNNKYNERYSRHSELSWFRRTIETIKAICLFVWLEVVGSENTDHNSLYYTNIGTTKRGFFGTITYGVSSFFVGLYRYLYMFIAYVLCLDTWLLQTTNPQNQTKKRFLLVLLIILPFLLLAAWSFLEESERNNYLEKIQAMVPIPLLTSLKASLHSSGATFKSVLQFPDTLTKLYSTHSEPTEPIKIEQLEESMRTTITPETYESILNHINSYVQHLVDYKIKEEQANFLKEQQRQKRSITPEQTQIIVQIMHENLERLTREKYKKNGENVVAFSDEELQKLVLLLKERLLNTKWREEPVQLTQENLEEITQLIQQQIELKKPLYNSITLEHVDLTQLLERILGAPQLAEFIDGRLDLTIDRKMKTHCESSGVHNSVLISEQEQRLLHDLNKEISFIKLSLADKTHENAELQQSISQLHVRQDELLQRLQQHEFAADKRFSVLLSEIESKLATLKEENFTLLNKQIKLSLIEILGYEQVPADAAKLEYTDLKNWMHSVFVAKDYLEQRLLIINNRTYDKIHEEIDRSAMLLMRDISERLKREMLLIVEKKYSESAAILKGEIRSVLSEDEVKNIVKSVLAIYDADKTGLVDFALESAGGSIISTRCTESYQTKSAQISVFGIPLWYPSNTPRVAISPNVQPGECWAFQGFPGFLVLKLNSFVYVTGFTLEHIPKSLSPTGHIDSAPRNFTVWVRIFPIQYFKFLLKNIKINNNELGYENHFTEICRVFDTVLKTEYE